MVQIIPENKKMSFGQKFSSAIGAGLTKVQEMREAELAREQQEKDFVRKQQLLEHEYGLKGGLEREKQAAKYSEKLKLLENQNIFSNDGQKLRGQETSKEGGSIGESLASDQQPHSPEKIAKVSAVDQGLGNVLQHQNDEWYREKREKKNQDIKAEEQKQKIFEADRKYHSEVSRPIIEKANETLKTADINKGVRQQLRRDIDTGNASGLYPFMVNKLGLTSFENPESARFTNEVKNLFVDSINQIPGARPNQFIEKFLSTAQPMIGRTVEANNSVLDVGDFIEDVKLEQAKQELEIAKEDRKKYGYVKEDVTERAREKMGDFVNRRQEKMAMDIRKRKEDTMQNADILNEIIGKTVSPGTYITPRTMRLLYIKNGNDTTKAIKEAESLGMVFPEYLE